MAHLEKHTHFLPMGGSLNSRYGNGDFKVWYKFGRNLASSTTEEDIWTTGGQEVLPTAGVSMYIACSDNVNGVGQVFEVSGLDENWAYKTEYVTLAGNTPTIIGSANSWTRIHRSHQVSASPDPVGDVYIAENSGDFVAGVPQTASNIHATINFTNASQQTEKCMLTVPAGHHALIYGFNTSIAASSTGTSRSVEAYIEVSELARGATVANPSWTPFRRIDQHSMRSDGNSTAGETFVFPLGPFGPLTNIHARCTSTAASVVLADMIIITYEV